MFVYLSKKIAIPNGVKLRSIAWNHDQGWIACGGDNGMLKVLKLDNSTKAGSNNLSMNQTLDGHEKAISVVTWNDHHRKLTSSDENGLIIVWILHKGMWFEEMINNRNRSVVRDVCWNADGRTVCIVYEDGAVIVGSVDGNRLWGKELKRQLSNVTWSPDSRYLLFGTLQGEVIVHDGATGQYRSKIFVQCVDEGTENRLAGVSWHPFSSESAPNAATLAICYENGKAQLMRNEADDKPFLIDTGLRVTSMRWNPQGSIVTFCGIPLVQTTDKSIVAAQFYSNMGIHLRTLRVPGSTCGGISWEGNGLRVALAVDSFIFFANVRPDYKWAYFNKTVVYSFSKPDRSDTCVMFWGVKNNERNIKYVHRLTHIKAAGDCCVIVARVEENAVQHSITLNNSIGAPVDTKYIDIEPTVVAISEHRVVACSEEMIFLWQYRDPTVIVDVLDPVSVQQARKESKEKLWHIEDLVSADQQGSTMVRKGVTNDLICSAALSEQYLFLGRESGLLHIYAFTPAITLVAKYVLPSRSHQLSANCDSTTLAVIDINGVLNLHTLNPADFSIMAKPSQPLPLERKDVWDLMWASDNPEMFAAMEKTRMYVFRGLDPEEPLQSSAHLCKFKSLKIRSVLLDDALADPEHPAKELVLDLETKSLRDTREILSTVSIKEAFQYVEDHPHPRLWSILAEAALGNLDFAIAEKAVVRCAEYPAIQFVKRVKTLDDPLKQRAEVLCYYHRFDDAEKVFRELDRKDLAVELRARLGDWFRVVQLVQEGGGDDALIRNAWEQIGDHFADRQKWSKAAQYYLQCRNFEKLAKVYYVMEDFKNLEKMIDMGSHSKELLIDMGYQFLSVGLAEAAVNTFLKAGEVRLAVTSCVDLNQWDQAIHLAEKHQLSDIGELLSKYAAHLIEKDGGAQAIELYRKASQHQEAAKLLAKLGQQAAGNGQPLKAKKFYVLAAIEIEKFRKKQMSLDPRTAAQVVDTLLNADKANVTDKSLDSAWRGAEAYHFYMLCHMQLYQNDVEAALVTAMRLMGYDDMINPIDAYSLIAITAYYARNFGICSKAFTKLEAVEASGGAPNADGKGSSSSAAAGADGTAPASPTNAAGGLGGGGALGLEFDLDVTKGTLPGVSRAVSVPTGTATGPGGRFVIPVVSLKDEPRRYGDLAVKIFTRNQPVDTSVDRAQCKKCGTFNREWATACSNNSCGVSFPACVATGRAITTPATAWTCSVCRHKALEEAVAKFNNCPLCHTALHQPGTLGGTQRQR